MYTREEGGGGGRSEVKNEDTHAEMIPNAAGSGSTVTQDTEISTHAYTLIPPPGMQVLF